MSFILDALKKIERQQQDQGAGSPKPGTIMAGGRSWGGGDRTLKVAFVLLGLVSLVALALAAVALVFGLRGGVSIETPHPPAARIAPEGSDGETSVESPEMGALPVERVREAPTRPSSSLGGGSSKSIREEREALAESSTGKGADLDSSLEETSVEEVEEVEEAAAPSLPVRLVGRGAEDISGEPSSVSDSNVAPEVPAEAPSLVLQGTSVVDGRPVAVINYRRVFEGDVIDGVIVIDITDRAVELELDGKRFTLRL